MKKTLTGATLLALTATTAYSAGLDRSGQSTSAIFAPNGSASVSFGYVTPSVTGSDIATATTGAPGPEQYDVGESYLVPAISYTNAINDKFSYSVMFDQPYGVDVSYGGNPGANNLGGTRADLNSQALTFAGKYQINGRFSVFGGVTVQRINAEVVLSGRSYSTAIATAGAVRQFNPIRPTGTPELTSELLGTAIATANNVNLAAGQAVVDGVYGLGTYDAIIAGWGTTEANLRANGGYQFDMKDTTEANYFIGAAYEIPDIALRFAATYRFETTHNSTATEAFGALAAGTNNVQFVTPQSLNLEFQTGIAQDTLLLASYRWVEYSAVDIIPAALGQDLVNLGDSERYTLGVGRRFSDKFSGSATMIFEPEGVDNTVSPLGPTNGMFGISLAGQYTTDNMKISGGINYSWLGNAFAEVGGQSVASFQDNTALGVGFKAEMTF